MGQTKLNRREAYTLRVIRESFLELLHKQSVERISVGELCQLADINRSTFYRHYADVYALLDEICEECCKELFYNLAKEHDPSGARFEEAAYSLILQACTLTENNKELYKTLLFHQPAARFQQRINDAIFQLWDTNHTISNAKTAEARLHYQFLISGILGIWQAWLRDDCTVPKAIVAQIVKVHIGGAFGVVLDQYGPSTRNH